MSILQIIQLNLSYFRLGWKVVKGRFFIFRNEPFWIVDYYTHLPLEEYEGIWLQLVVQARAEWDLRLSRATERPAPMSI